MAGRIAICIAVIVAFSAPAASGSPWPLWPKNQPHPIRAGIIDPRGLGCFANAMPLPVEERECKYHRGVDIVSNDARCNPKAPPLGCRRVYAVRGGKVTAIFPAHSKPTRCGRIDVGRFVYSHVYMPHPRALKRRVFSRGQVVGWTCRGAWHIHFAEKVVASDVQGDRLNPLRPGGVLDSFNRDDVYGPQVKAVELGPDGELWARIEDQVPEYRGVVRNGALRYADTYNDLPPYWIKVNGVYALSPTRRLPTRPFWDVYAPLLFRNLRVAECAAAEEIDCTGEYWFRLGFPTYPAVIETGDTAGNTVTVEIAEP